MTRSVFVSIANLDIEPRRRRVQLYADDILIEAKDLRTSIRRPGPRSIIDDVPARRLGHRGPASRP